MRTALQAGGKTRKPSKLRSRPSAGTRSEPKLGAALVPAPRPGISRWERAAWLELKALVDPLGVYTPSDSVAFEQVALNLAVIRQAAAALRELGVTMEGVGSNGQPTTKARPEVQVYQSAEKLLWLGLARFGLSPADRSRVVAADPARTERDRAMDEFA